MKPKDIDIDELLNYLQVAKGICEAGKAKRLNNPMQRTKAGARRYLWEVQCRNCGHTATKKSPDALYCSDLCKVDFFHRKKQAVAFAEQHGVEEILQFLEEYLASLSLLAE